MMGLLDFLKPKKPRTVAKELTAQQLKARINATITQGYLNHLKESPDETLALGRKLFGYHPPNLKEVVLEKILAENPDMEMEFARQQMRAMGIKSGDIFTQIRAHRELMAELEGDREPSAGIGAVLKNLVTPELVIALVAGLKQAQGAPAQNGSSVSAINGHIPTPALQSGASQGGTITVDELLEVYIANLSHQLDDSDTSPQECAYYAVMELNRIAGILYNANQPLDRIHQINGLIDQPVEQFANTLTILSITTGNADLQRLVQRLQTDAGKQYLVQFCNARDALYIELAQERAAAQSEKSE